MIPQEIIVVIDGGHGDKDPGAIGPKGTKEKDVNLSVALALGDILTKRHVKVFFTRQTDRVSWNSGVLKTDLSSRIRIANNIAVANKEFTVIFVSIHSNSGSATASGMEIYTTKGDTSADKLAELICEAWPGAIRKDLSDGDSDKEANFAVISKTNMPAVLIELGFISNPVEEQQLASQSFQLLAAKSIADGIGRYFNFPKEGGNAVNNPAKIINGALYVPLRDFLEEVGGKVTKWDQSLQKATFTVGGKTYEAVAGSKEVKEVK